LVRNEKKAIGIFLQNRAGKIVRTSKLDSNWGTPSSQRYLDKLLCCRWHKVHWKRLKHLYLNLSNHFVHDSGVFCSKFTYFDKS
jgi:hypothetical protein